jgi:hypothetical protein
MSERLTFATPKAGQPVVGDGVAGSAQADEPAESLYSSTGIERPAFMSLQRSARAVIMRRRRSQSAGTTQERTLVNQQEDGTRSTNRPLPRLRSSPGSKSGTGAFAIHRASVSTSASGAYQRLAPASHRAPPPSSLSKLDRSRHPAPQLSPRCSDT